MEYLTMSASWPNHFLFLHLHRFLVYQTPQDSHLGVYKYWPILSLNIVRVTVKKSHRQTGIKNVLRPCDGDNTYVSKIDAAVEFYMYIVTSWSMVWTVIP